MPVCTKQNRIAGSALEMELSVAIISSHMGGVLTPPVSFQSTVLFRSET